VEGHPRASIFHTRGWLEALHRTYGYEPIAYTTSRPAATLTNAIVFCRICSWLTGRRLVSLPFADHCEPLMEDRESFDQICCSLQRVLDAEKLRYIEIRPRSADLAAEPQMQKADSFCFHALDLRPTLDKLFRQLQKDSIQRKIRRAEREGLSYQAGYSEALLKAFYDLLVLTRRRHRVPPQPIAWFQNLIACQRDRIRIQVAFKEGRAIASLLTLWHGHTLIYKYGGSDANFHSLGAVPYLFWKAIEEGKKQGFQEFDLGRSDTDNAGLITFKDRLAATRSELRYLRCSTLRRRSAVAGYGAEAARRLFAVMPDGVLSVAGKLLYRHVG